MSLIPAIIPDGIPIWNRELWDVFHVLTNHSDAIVLHSGYARAEDVDLKDFFIYDTIAYATEKRQGYFGTDANSQKITKFTLNFFQFISIVKVEGYRSDEGTFPTLPMLSIWDSLAQIRLKAKKICG